MIFDYDHHELCHRCGGQVLAEAVIMLALISVLILGMASTFRLQWQWHRSHLDAHLTAERLSFGHADIASAPMVSPYREGKVSSLMGTVMKFAQSALDSLTRGAISLASRVWRGMERLERKARTYKARHHLQSYASEKGYRANVTTARFSGDSQQTRHMDPLLDGSMVWVKVESKSPTASHAWQLKGQGAAAYAHETVERIEDAKELWKQTSSRSQKLVRRLAPFVEPVDRAWQRDAPTEHWLDSWVQVSEFEDGEHPRSWLDDVVDTGKKWLGKLF